MAYAYRDEGFEGTECFACGKFFIRKYGWQKQCWDCFITSPAGREWAQRNSWEQRKYGKADSADPFKYQGKAEQERAAREYAEKIRQAQQAENQRKYEQANRDAHERQRQRNEEFNYQYGSHGKEWWEREHTRESNYQKQQQKFEDFFQERKPHRPASSSSVGLDKELLRKLIMLCHPDKHGGSELSTSVTVQLLKMKEGL